jgi:hypothetical protein
MRRCGALLLILYLTMQCSVSFTHSHMSFIVQYHSLNQYSSSGIGYASANLRLMSVRYNILELFPINLCGDWIESYTSNYDAGNSSDICPGWDGSYFFSVPYTLPYDEDGITTWLATGYVVTKR